MAGTIAVFLGCWVAVSDLLCALLDGVLTMRLRLLGIVVLCGFRYRGGRVGLCLVLLMGLLNWLCAF